MTDEERTLLQTYAHTSDKRYALESPGARYLARLGFLEDRGTEYGLRFYSITDAGRKALEEK